jgi:hypothetical protein
MEAWPIRRTASDADWIGRKGDPMIFGITYAAHAL